MLARNVNKWTSNDDARLHHLMCYGKSTLDKRTIGRVGDSIADLGCGLWIPHACSRKASSIPIAGGSKRQGCVSHSTPEAEIVAADMTLRNYGIPPISFWQVLIRKAPEILFHTDKQGMIGVARTGRNPTLGCPAKILFVRRVLTG